MLKCKDHGPYQEFHGKCPECTVLGFQQVRLHHEYVGSTPHIVARLETGVRYKRGDVVWTGDYNVGSDCWDEGHEWVEHSEYSLRKIKFDDDTCRIGAPPSLTDWHANAVARMVAAGHTVEGVRKNFELPYAPWCQCPLWCAGTGLEARCSSWECVWDSLRQANAANSEWGRDFMGWLSTLPAVSR